VLPPPPLGPRSVGRRAKHLHRPLRGPGEPTARGASPAAGALKLGAQRPERRGGEGGVDLGEARAEASGDRVVGRVIGGVEVVRGSGAGVGRGGSGRRLGPVPGRAAGARRGRRSRLPVVATESAAGPHHHPQAVNVPGRLHARRGLVRPRGRPDGRGVVLIDRRRPTPPVPGLAPPPRLLPVAPRLDLLRRPAPPRELLGWDGVRVGALGEAHRAPAPPARRAVGVVLRVGKGALEVRRIEEGSRRQQRRGVERGAGEERGRRLIELGG